MPLRKGGRGKKGGLTEYAKKVGKDVRTVSEYRQAAEVFGSLVETIRSSGGFLDKAKHLAAIHAANQPLWLSRTICPNQRHHLPPHRFRQAGPCRNHGRQIGVDWHRIAGKCA